MDVKVWNGFSSFRIGSNGGLLWTWLRIFGFHKVIGISWSVEYHLREEDHALGQFLLQGLKLFIPYFYQLPLASSALQYMSVKQPQDYVLRHCFHYFASVLFYWYMLFSACFWYLHYIYDVILNPADAFLPSAFFTFGLLSTSNNQIHMTCCIEC
jgi:hypothetical protein